MSAACQSERRSTVCRKIPTSSPPKFQIAPFCWGSGHPPNTRLVESTRVYSPNGNLIGSAVFARRHTDIQAQDRHITVLRSTSVRIDCTYFTHGVWTSPPKVIWEECVATTPRRRMHSPAACASCTMRNITEPLRNVEERYGTVSERYARVTGRYGTLRNRYGKYRFCPSLTINIKF